MPTPRRGTPSAAGSTSTSAPPASASSTLAPPRTARVEGVVNGAVTIDNEYADLNLGPLFLLLLGLGGVLFFRGLLEGLTRPGGVGGLLSVVLLFVMFGMIFSLIFGVGPGRYFRWLGRTATSSARAGVRGLSRGAAAGGRGAVGALGTAGSAGRSNHSTQVRRFRVQSDDGMVHSCILRGELMGDDVRQGDRVRVLGRRNRHQQLTVKRVEVLATSTGPVVATVEARLPVGLLVARNLAWVVRGLLAAVALLVVVVVVGWVV